MYVRKGLSKKLFLVAFLEIKSINSILLAFSYSLHVQSCVAFVMAKYWISMEKKPGHGRNIFLVRKLEQFEMFNERITQILGEWKLLKHKVRFGLFFWQFLDLKVISTAFWITVCTLMKEWRKVIPYIYQKYHMTSSTKVYRKKIGSSLHSWMTSLYRFSFALRLLYFHSLDASLLFEASIMIPFMSTSPPREV